MIMAITQHEKLEELLVAARRWRLMLDTFERMRNSIHPGMRYQALGTPARDVRHAEVTFWKVLAELESEL